MPPGAKEPSESIAGRVVETLDLFEAGVAMMEQNLRRRDPGATDREIEERLDAWIRTRPGAEDGDGDGVPGAWPPRP